MVNVGELADRIAMVLIAVLLVSLATLLVYNLVTPSKANGDTVVVQSHEHVPFRYTYRARLYDERLCVSRDDTMLVKAQGKHWTIPEPLRSEAREYLESRK